MDTKNSEISRLLHKTFMEAIDNLDKNYEGSSLTDIFITVDKETGEVAFYDDEENKVSEIVIFDWVERGDDLKDEAIVNIMKEIATQLKDEDGFLSLDIYKPFSINYSDESFEVIEEILCIDDEAIVELDMDNNLMEKFDKEFDEFLEKLLKD